MLFSFCYHLYIFITSVNLAKHANVYSTVTVHPREQYNHIVTSRIAVKYQQGDRNLSSIFAMYR